MDEALGGGDIVEHGLEHGGKIGEDANFVAVEEGGVVGLVHHVGQLLVFVGVGAGEDGVSDGLVAQHVEVHTLVGLDGAATAVILAQQVIEGDAETRNQDDEHDPEDGEVGLPVLGDDDDDRDNDEQ